MAGLDNDLLRTALDNQEDFYRLCETLTDKALRHYTVASYTHSVQANMTDLAVLKFYLQEYGAAASYFYRITPFFGENGWSLLELSMLIMYANALKELKRKDEYVRGSAEAPYQGVCCREGQGAARATLRPGRRESASIDDSGKKAYPEASSVSGYFGELLTTAASLEKEVKVPLASFFADAEIENVPELRRGSGQLFRDTETEELTRR